MYFEEKSRPEKKNLLHFMIALVAAVTINTAIGAALIHGGIDNQSAHAGLMVPYTVANLGTLPEVTVSARREKV